MNSGGRELVFPLAFGEAKAYFFPVALFAFLINAFDEFFQVGKWFFRHGCCPFTIDLPVSK